MLCNECSLGRYSRLTIKGQHHNSQRQAYKNRKRVRSLSMKIVDGVEVEQRVQLQAFNMNQFQQEHRHVKSM